MLHTYSTQRQISWLSNPILDECRYYTIEELIDCEIKRVGEGGYKLPSADDPHTEKLKQ